MNSFLKSYSFKSVITTVVASGLYPLLHYYSNNLDLVGARTQHLFMLGVCFVLPLVLVIVSLFFLRFKLFVKSKKYLLTAINLMTFFGLLSVVIFHFEKKPVFLILLISGLASLVLYKYLNKIIVLQFLLAFMSVFNLVPKVIFASNYKNDWVALTDDIKAVKLVHTPNIYVIQPDGYANIEVLSEPPYSFNNAAFNNWLEADGFVNYKGFRSNYYSTLTSNASMFAMKHHYYSNTFKGNLKTFHANQVISGKQNNVLHILKNNNYSSYLLTDNSHFLIDRVPLQFDYCNVPESKILKYDSGYIPGIDIVNDFEGVLKEMDTSSNNFFFIESTIPSHIAYRKSSTLSIDGERVAYIERLQDTNIWLKNLIDNINRYDKNPMIIIVADHGGFVGLNYVLEVLTKKLNEEEIVSAFNSMLSIKWPNNIDASALEFKSNVNLFRNIFSVLAEDTTLLKSKEANNSYIPLKENGEVIFYQCIDEDYNAAYKLINND
jgi:hypothetical protein